MKQVLEGDLQIRFEKGNRVRRMKDVAVIICNYNKQDYVLRCISSVLDSSFSDFDIYVVDNASTDRSVCLIEENFGEKVRLLVNEENLGGAGGFDTGIRAALKGAYKYLLLLDNDIVVDKKAIEELYQFMERDTGQEVGIVGSKVYFMDEPETIWGYGGMIDFDAYIQRDLYKNCVESQSIPQTHECDYVPACSLLVRKKAVEEVGIMPEDNFIYWDDMEWGYRFRQAGYKVAVWGKSKAWHKGGGRNAGNTFIHYYMWRNRLHFFMRVLEEEKWGHFADTVLSELFRMIYSLQLKGERHVIETLMYAFDDAVHGVRGKATQGKVLPRPQVTDRLAEMLQGKQTVLVKYNGDREGLGNIVRALRRVESVQEVVIEAAADAASVEGQYPDCLAVRSGEDYHHDIELVMCAHIFKLEKGMPYAHYIDAWCNVICSELEFGYARGFEQMKELFLLCQKPILMEGFRRLAHGSLGNGKRR